MKESEPLSTDDLCSHCGLKKGQVGSLTYWIFKGSRCQCDLGGSLTEPGNQATELRQPSGKQILNDRYELLECVGRGGTGFVYKGLDIAEQKVVALKLMHPDLAENNLAVKRLKKEVAVVSSLSHSNLGQMYGYGQEKDGLPYLVMEFLEGESLAQIVKAEGKLSPERALDLFIQITSGLSCAHTNGVIHRDLKPGNVIVQQTENGHECAIIVDFGFARLLQDATDSVRLTQEGEAFGSPAYMSPEQCLGQELDVRSDIYSLGCLMYEALTGDPPLVGENVLATVAKQVKENPRSMRTRDPGIPEEIDTIVMKCLNKEPVLRYQTASDLRVDLDKFKQGEFRAGRTTRARKNATTEIQGDSKTSLRSLEGLYSREITMLVRVAFVAILIGGISAGTVWFAMQQRTQGANPVQQSNVPQEQEASKQIEKTVVERPAVILPTKSKKPSPKQGPARAVARRNTSVSMQSSSQRPAANAGKSRSNKKAASIKSAPSSNWDKLKGLREFK